MVIMQLNVCVTRLNKSPVEITVTCPVTLTVDGRFVSEKVAGVAPLKEAVTVYGPPAVPFAVTVALATPDAFVCALVPTMLAPLPGPA